MRTYDKAGMAWPGAGPSLENLCGSCRRGCFNPPSWCGGHGHGKQRFHPEEYRRARLAARELADPHCSILRPRPALALATFVSRLGSKLGSRAANSQANSMAAQRFASPFGQESRRSPGGRNTKKAGRVCSRARVRKGSVQNLNIGAAVLFRLHRAGHRAGQSAGKGFEGSRRAKL
jgi:hypothetical protein